MLTGVAGRQMELSKKWSGPYPGQGSSATTLFSPERLLNYLGPSAGENRARKHPARAGSEPGSKSCRDSCANDLRIVLGALEAHIQLHPGFIQLRRGGFLGVFYIGP
jgi:hypothetical protein